MYERILLAYDGSREGLIALREGALLSRRCGAKVFLLSILSPNALGGLVGDGVYGDLPVEELETYKELLERGVAAAKQLGLDPVAKMVIGEPAQQIGAYAKEIDADLVVIGHRRHNLLERWWSGSTGAYVSDNVDCSVLIGRKLISNEAFLAEIGAASPTPAERSAPASPALRP
jgi:nucleotide-binding universal stress UspA family protein